MGFIYKSFFFFCLMIGHLLEMLAAVKWTIYTHLLKCIYVWIVFWVEFLGRESCDKRASDNLFMESILFPFYYLGTISKWMSFFFPLRFLFSEVQIFATLCFLLLLIAVYGFPLKLLCSLSKERTRKIRRFPLCLMAQFQEVETKWLLFLSCLDSLYLDTFNWRKLRHLSP